MKHTFSDCFLLGSVSKDGEASWFHTLPAIGEYPEKQLIVQGKKVTGTIVVDQTAVDRCLAAFKARAAEAGWQGLLVDREHFSLMANKESDAMAWAKDIRADSDGVWTRWDYTEPGKKLWDGKILISRSPVMDLEPLGGNRYRPVDITSIAMTNTPQFETLSTFAAARAVDDTNQKGNAMDKLLCDELGIPETATVADAVAKIKALKSAASTSEAEMKKAQAACRKSECDAFIAANKASIKDEAAFRAAFEKDPETVKSTFAACRAIPGATPPGTRIEASKGKTPDASAGGSQSGAQIAAKRQSAVNSYRAANPGTSFSVAWSACRAADPALFADEASAD